MTKSYKEQLSEHVESIFKQYATPGLHICDIATGGGKSYTIGKLTCEYYPQYFDRIVILCVQNKLVEGMNREIERFIDSSSSLIKADQKLVIENNLLSIGFSDFSNTNYLNKNGFEIERKRIEIPGVTIKTTGNFHCTVHLYESQIAEVKISVTAQNSSAEKEEKPSKKQEAAETPVAEEKSAE